MPDFDVIAIGGGAAGLTIAIGGAQLGLRVALVERHRFGGECTWMGCVPSKAMLHVAAIAAAAKQAAAWSTNGAAAPQVDFAKAIAHVRGARQMVGDEESPEALGRRGITALAGTALLKPGGIVEVDGRPYSARHIVVATGSDPSLVPIPGLADVRLFTNESIFDELDTLPAHLGVIGGGPIGSELAQAFARLGSRVTLFQSSNRLLTKEEEAVGPVIRAALERDGVTIHFGAKVTRAAAAPDGGRGATLTVEGTGDVEVDALLVAVGRRARTKDLGLEELGVKLTRDGVWVDEYMQTSVPGVWATGDVVGPYRFTHVAEMQGRVVLRNILFPWRKQKMDYRVIPWATFTDPEIGRVGLTEAEAREQYGSKAAGYTFPLSHVDRAIAEGETDGFIKLVVRGKEVLGATVVGSRGGDLVQTVALAMKRKLPVSALSMVHVYPAHVYGLHQAADRVGQEQLALNGPGKATVALLRRLALRG